MDEIEKDGKRYTYFKDLAAITGYDAEYLRKLAKAKKVDALQIGTAWMINRESVDRYKSGYKSRRPR